MAHLCNILVLERLRQGNCHTFEMSLGYIVCSRLAWATVKTKVKTKTGKGFCNPATWEVEIGGSGVQGQSQLRKQTNNNHKTPSQTKDHWATPLGIFKPAPLPCHSLDNLASLCPSTSFQGPVRSPGTPAPLVHSARWLSQRSHLWLVSITRGQQQVCADVWNVGAGGLRWYKPEPQQSRSL